MIDVCLLLEGTYPYVAGGVSTWVHQLISSMQDIRFGIVYIAPHSDPTRQMKYEVPNHVLFLKEINLHDYQLEMESARPAQVKDYDALKIFYEELLHQKTQHFPQFLKLVNGDNACFDAKELFYSKQSWKLLLAFYERYAPDISFLDFFWTFRATHLPLLDILQANIPKAKVYHSVSTGYAGLLGAMAKIMHEGIFFLTEHGIYTHERMLEISQADWIYEQEKKNYRAERDLSFFKKWWTGIFKILSYLSYQYADQIFTLFEGNKIRQVFDGADPKKIDLIPNGIDVKNFSLIKLERKSTPQVGLVGRVVSIKDIKTFIQAARIALNEIPEIQFYIIGPTDEEEDYYEECKMLVEVLELEQKVTFTGRVNPKDYYSFLDLLVLTSTSEAQPYVILEGNAMGIPVVASDVGACQELLEGRDPEDKLLGPSGLLTETANPDETARGIIRLIQDKTFYAQCSEAGKERVRRFYDQDDLLSRYLNLYEKYL